MGCNSSKASAQDPPTAYHASGGANSTTIGNASVAPSLRSQELVVTGGGSFILSRGDAEAPIGSSNSSSSSNASAGGGSGGATGAAAHPSAVSSASASDNSSSSSDGPLSADPGGGTMVVSKGGSYVIGRKYAGAWEPGTPIERPDNFLSARSAYIPLDEQKTRFLKLSYSAYSEQGKSPKPPIKPNQDSFVAIEKLGNDEHLALFGVFDGHGPKGEDASNFCRINLPDITVRAPGFQQQPFEALRRSFEATHKRFISPEVSRLPGVDVAVSGSTAIAVMFNRDLLTCANVGDSRAMIGTLGPRGNMIARPLSIDHKPNRPEERARLMQASGRILSERQLGIEGGDPDKFYVCRLHGGTIRYGVLFTRSIGDADGHANLGLSSAPEVKAGRLDSRDKFVVLATDGVWDYLREDDVAALVMEADGDAHMATLNVVQTAKACWDREPNSRRDDITAIVILLSFLTAEQVEEEKKKDQKELGSLQTGSNGGATASLSPDHSFGDSATGGAASSSSSSSSSAAATVATVAVEDVVVPGNGASIVTAAVAAVVASEAPTVVDAVVAETTSSAAVADAAGDPRRPATGDSAAK